MKASVVSVFALFLAGCEYHPPGMTSADVQAFAAERPGITAKCLDDVRWGRRDWGDAGEDPDCFEMLPEQRWSGLWEDGWEWTNFCAEPAKQCDWMAKSGTWLTFAEGAYPKGEVPDGTYRIEFIGRRTKIPGQFGHDGAYEHLMVVDRLISIRTIPGEEYQKRY